MEKYRIYAEVSFKLGLELEGVSRETRSFDVRKHKGEIYRLIEERFSKGLSDAEDVKIHYFDFGMVR